MKAPHVHNYVVGFFDLLGQRTALEGQGLLKTFATTDDEQAFVATLRQTIGAIATLQQRAEEIRHGALRIRRNSPLRQSLSKKERLTWDAMHRAKLTTQRWSDGLVNFICLGDQTIKCPMTGVYALFGLAGALCYLGLASKLPIRGAIDIAWAVELHKGELYGAAIARAYELESEIAQWPRIVVGPEAIRYLEVQRQAPGTDPFSGNNRALAEVCLKMLRQDTDGHWIVDYLGEGFRLAAGTSVDAEMYARARDFVSEQLATHEAQSNHKLVSRYRRLRDYYEANAAQLLSGADA